MTTYQDLFNICKEKIELTWTCGQAAASEVLAYSSTANPYATLSVGYLNIIHPDRFHVFGPEEINYLSHLDQNSRTAFIRTLLEGKTLGFIVCDGLKLSDDVIETINRANLPVFSSPEAAEEVLAILRHEITKVLAPRCSMHGVFMDVFGMGILLSGQSGVGKSELGLELVSRGHGLVADDVVDFMQKGPNWVEGQSPELLANLLEVRGIGLLDIKTIFGETAVRRKMRLRLVAELVKCDDDTPIERLPEKDLYIDILDQPIRKIIIPVGGGRNLAVLVEAAVRSSILQMRGINTIQDFFNRQRTLLKEEDSLN